MFSWFCSFHKSLYCWCWHLGRWAFRWLVALWVTLCAALSEPSQAEQGVQLTPLHILHHQQQVLRCHRRQNKLQLSFSVCPSRFLSLSHAFAVYIECLCVSLEIATEGASNNNRNIKHKPLLKLRPLVVQLLD